MAIIIFEEYEIFFKMWKII